MDLKSIGKQVKSSTGVPMQLESPNGLPLFAYNDPDKGWQVTEDPEKVTFDTFPCNFLMVGEHSAQFRKRKAALFNTMQRRGKKKVKFSEQEQTEYDMVSAGVAGWDYVVWPGADGKGILLEYTDENVEMVLRDYPPSFSQANLFIADTSNFFTSAATG